MSPEGLPTNSTPPAASGEELGPGSRSLDARRIGAGVAGILLLAFAGLVNLQILGLAEVVTLERSRLAVAVPGLPWSSAVTVPGGAAGLAVACLVAFAVVAVCLRALARWTSFARPVAALRSRDRRSGLAVGVGLLAFGFLPIGLLRSLAATYLFYLAAMPGFVLVLYAAWPRFHRFVARATPTLDRVVFDSSPRLFIGTVFGVTLLLAGSLSFLLFDFTPRIPTGIAHWFHARILTSGALYAEAPPLPEFFSLLTVVSDSGRWYSIFPLGHTALVAGALLLGLPWIVNPVCGAVSVVLFYLLGRELYGDRTGRLAALFGVLSPFLMFMSAEFYNNASSLVFCTGFLLFFARVTKAAKVRDGLLAGLFLGLVLNTRPVTAVAVALPFIGYSLWLLLKDPGRFMKPLLGLGGAGLAFVVLLLVSSYGITGNPLATGYSHADPVTQERAIDLSRVVPNSVVRVRLVNRYLFQWAVPSLLPIALLFASSRAARWDYLLLSLVPSGLLAYAAWYHLGHELGPRYLYFTTGALVLLAVRGVQAFPGLVSEAAGRSIGLATKTGAAAVVLACFLSAALLSWVPMATLYGSDRWWPLDRSVVEQVRSAGLQNVVVFVPDGVFRAVFLDNAVPVDEGEIVYARDLGGRNHELMARFPGRRYYRTASGRLEELDPTP